MLGTLRVGLRLSDTALRAKLQEDFGMEGVEDSTSILQLAGGITPLACPVHCHLLRNSVLFFHIAIRNELRTVVFLEVSGDCS